MRALERIIIFTLLLSIFYIAHSEICPQLESVRPCTCRVDEEYVEVVLHCSNKDITLNQLENFLKALGLKETIGVELDEINLGTVPSDFFKGFNVKYLQLSHCQLDSLAGGGGKPLEGLEYTLERLTIDSSFTEDNQAGQLSLSHLKTLRELELSYNIITEIDNNWFKNAPPSLHRIMISNNGIEKIGDKAFADVTNLEFLSLDGNRFGRISRSMLPNPANELDTLELDNNALINLPEDLFTGMPYLKEISLATNGLTKLEEKTWKSIWNQLDDIDLRGNPLECDSHMDWMSKTPTCTDISGTCVFPLKKSGQRIPFISHDYCSYDK